MPYILLSLLLTITTSKILSATVEGMQLSHSNHGTCIVFNIVGNIKYDVFTLIAPDRLVIDFDNSQHTTNLAIPKFKNALINDIRYIQLMRRCESLGKHSRTFFNVYWAFFLQIHSIRSFERIF